MFCGEVLLTLSWQLWVNGFFCKGCRMMIGQHRDLKCREQVDS